MGRYAALGVLLSMLLIMSPSAWASQPVKFGFYENKPLNFQHAGGAPQGVIIDVLESFAQAERLEVDFVDCQWHHCLELLERGEIDLFGAIGYTEERAKRYDFTEQAVLTNWGVVIAAPGTGIEALTDLEDRRIAALKQAGHTHALQKLLSDFGIEGTFVETPGSEDVFRLVAAGVADAGVVNRLQANQYAGQYLFRKTPILFNPLEIRFAAPRGGSTELIRALDTHLARLKNAPDSVLYASLERWLGKQPERMTPAWVLWGAGALLLGLLVLGAVSAFLRVQVRLRTRMLEKEVVERREAQARLVEHDRMKGEFISMASHELRTPLTVVRGYVELLMESPGLSEDQAQLFLSRVYDKTLTLQRMVDELLDVSRIESGRPLSLHPEALCLHEVALDVLEPFQTQCQKHRFIMDIPPASAMVLADRGRLVQVLENLLGNAVKFSPDGGNIVLRGECRGEWWVVTVCDEGIGMEPEEVAQIFERFFRADNSDKAVEGLGVGLHLVRNIVESHGGSIRAKSRKGEGTAIEFRLPVSVPGHEVPYLAQRAEGTAVAKGGSVGEGRAKAGL